MQNFTRYSDAKVNKFSMGFKYNLLYVMNLYIDNETRYITSMKTCSVYGWNQNKADNSVYSYLIRKLCLCKRHDMCKNSSP